MEAKELRIGNKLLFCNKLHTVMGIGVNSLFIYNDFKHIIGPYEFEDFQPIPLTEEWLIDFGFEMNEYSYQYSYKLGVVEIWLINGKLEDDYDNEIKYVHQLQNLYFALTGQELTFSE